MFISQIRRVLISASPIRTSVQFLSSHKSSDFSAASQLGSSASRKDRKRFYRDVSVQQVNDANYEITLDGRALRTPGGQRFTLHNTLFAEMVAEEWRAQTDTIKPNTMHLTAIVNTATDNPNKLNRETIVASLKDYLLTDTVLFFDDVNDANAKLNENEERRWTPLVNWFNTRFPDANLTIQRDAVLLEDITELVINPSKDCSFSKYMLGSYDFASLIAFTFMSEGLKSVILSTALVEQQLPCGVEEACELANLEQIHQYENWGKVDWYHGVNESELRARVSAALICIKLNSAKSKI